MAPAVDMKDVPRLVTWWRSFVVDEVEELSHSLDLPCSLPAVHDFSPDQTPLIFLLLSAFHNDDLQYLLIISITVRSFLSHAHRILTRFAPRNTL